MRIQIKTKVKGNYKDIIRKFDRNLFEALKPRHAKMEIVEFTGSEKGDKVHIRFHSPVKADWISHITENGQDDKEAYFIDEGVTLPFPLSYWQHRHVVQKISNDSSYIIDDISFKGVNMLMSLILFPAIYLGFYPRKSIYKVYFNTAHPD